MELDAALADFDRARTEWEEAFSRVPDGALRYLKPGDDYSLGGLQVHVNWVLAHYWRVLEAIIAAGFRAVGPQDPPGAEEDARRGAKDGIAADDRDEAVKVMGGAHTKIVRAIAGLGATDWRRKAPVVYGEGPDPYPTSAEDIIGWLADHYREHVSQTAELIEDWRSAKAAG